MDPGRIDSWRERAPWQDPLAVETDLWQAVVLTRLFARPGVNGRLATRGGVVFNQFVTGRRYRATPDLDLVTLDDDTESGMAAVLEVVRPLFPNIRSLRAEFGPKIAVARRSALDPTRFVRFEIHVIRPQAMITDPVPLPVDDGVDSAIGLSYALIDATAVKAKGFVVRHKGSDLLDLAMVLRAGALTRDAVHAGFRHAWAAEPVWGHDTLEATLAVKRAEAENLAAEIRSMVSADEAVAWTPDAVQAAITDLAPLFEGMDG